MASLQTETTIQQKQEQSPSIPRVLPWGILAICLLPSALLLVGVDFSTQGLAVDNQWALQTQQSELLEYQFLALSGAFTHALLEWTAFCIAGFVVFLGFSHYRITKDDTTPIIALAFFTSGCMDAFHTLAAARLIDALADNSDFIPFTWAISRLFSAMILIIGVTIAIFRKPQERHKPDLKFIVGISLVFGLCTYIIIILAATSPALPQTTYPNALVSRPYDVLPLLLFIFAGVVIYPLLYRRQPSIFAYCLIISAIPEVITQLHMTFGSTALYDSHFNIAHFLKIIAYTVPLLGLTLDFTQAHQELQSEIHDRKDAEQALKEIDIRQKTILATVADAIITISKYGVIESFNPAAEKIFGYNKNEVIGTNITMLVPTQNSNEDSEYKVGNPDFQPPSIFINNDELHGRRKNGQIFPIEFNMANMDVDGEIGYVGILRDITERSENEKTLQYKTEEAEAASNAKSGFLATMSHEIRTPMNAVLGVLGLLRDSPLNEQQLQLVQTGHDSGELLLYIINDILDFSKMEADKFKLENSAFDLHRLLHNTVELLRHQAEHKGLSLLLILDRDLPQYAKSDADRLRQILINLINNAIKFTNEGSIIVSAAVTVDKNDQLELQCSVDDTGIGIPLEKQQSLFKEFTMVDHSYSRYQEGTGLGLAICKRLVVLMGGEIHCSSDIGKGSSFNFSIHLQPSSESQALIRSEVSEILPASNTRILLAEDNAANQMIIKSILECANLKVDIVANGREAVEAVSNIPYDIVLMDISMPEMDGMTATRNIRALPGEVGKLPIVALTAHALSEDKQRFLAAGMNDYLSKPIDRNAALYCIASWTLPMTGEDVKEQALGSKNLKQQSNSNSEYVDEAVLQQMVKDTAAEIAPKLLMLYIEDAKQRSLLIKSAIESQDMAKLEFECHTLGSSAAAHGNAKLHQFARKTEQLCTDGHHQQALSTANTLLNLTDESFRQLGKRARQGFT